MIGLQNQKRIEIGRLPTARLVADHVHPGVGDGHVRVGQQQYRRFLQVGGVQPVVGIETADELALGGTDGRVAGGYHAPVGPVEHRDTIETRRLVEGGQGLRVIRAVVPHNDLDPLQGLLVHRGNRSQQIPTLVVDRDDHRQQGRATAAQVAQVGDDGRLGRLGPTGPANPARHLVLGRPGTSHQLPGPAVVDLLQLATHPGSVGEL